MYINWMTNILKYTHELILVFFIQRSIPRKLIDIIIIIVSGSCINAPFLRTSNFKLFVTKHDHLVVKLSKT